MKYWNILVLVLYPFTFPAFSLIILISLLKRWCPCSFPHKQQHKHIAVTRTLLSIVRIIHNPFLNADFPWHGNDVTISIHVFFKVTTICALCSNLQLWKGRRKHCSCGRQLQKFTCRKKKQHKTNRNQHKTWQQSKVRLRLLMFFFLLFLRMKTLLTLVRRNLVRRSTTVLFIFKKAAFIRASFPSVAII